MKMPCHITDGPQEPEDLAYPKEEDEDEAYERVRQEEIDARIAPKEIKWPLTTQSTSEQ